MRRSLYAAGIIAILLITGLSHSQQQGVEMRVPPVIKTPSSIGEVSFPHQKHYTEFGITCKSCHHETNAMNLKVPHPEYFNDVWTNCNKCHHEKITHTETQKCSHCHHVNPTNVADETMSAKVVIHKQCGTCHGLNTGSDASKNCKLCHIGQRTKN